MSTISENPTNQMAIALAIKDSIAKQGCYIQVEDGSYVLIDGYVDLLKIAERVLEVLG